MPDRGAVSASLGGDSIPRAGREAAPEPAADITIGTDPLIITKGSAAAWRQDAPSPSETDTLAPDAPGATILVLVQNALVRKLLMESARHRGFEALGAVSLKAAIPLLRQARPDLMVLDTKLRRAYAPKLATWVDEAPELADIPIILLASRADGVELRHLRLLGYDRLIAQPISVPRFFEAVDAILH